MKETKPDIEKSIINDLLEEAKNLSNVLGALGASLLTLKIKDSFKL